MSGAPGLAGRKGGGGAHSRFAGLSTLRQAEAAAAGGARGPAAPSEVALARAAYLQKYMDGAWFGRAAPCGGNALAGGGASKNGANPFSSFHFSPPPPPLSPLTHWHARRRPPRRRRPGWWWRP